MHDLEMQVPLKDIAAEEKYRYRQPFPPANTVKVLGVQPQRRESNDINQEYVDRSVVPAVNPRPVFLPIITLPFTEHVRRLL